MYGLKTIIFCTFFFLILCGREKAKAQTKPKGGAEFSTQNTRIASSNSGRKEVVKRKKIAHIYKNGTENILYGNPCATEATRKMGFVYVLQVKGIPGSIDEKQMFYNNLWVNIKLIITRSPFWRIVLKRKLKACRQKSGDIVG